MSNYEWFEVWLKVIGILIAILTTILGFMFKTMLSFHGENRKRYHDLANQFNAALTSMMSLQTWRDIHEEQCEERVETTNRIFDRIEKTMDKFQDLYRGVPRK